MTPLAPFAPSHAGLPEDTYYFVKLDGARPNARDVIPEL